MLTIMMALMEATNTSAISSGPTGSSTRLQQQHHADIRLTPKRESCFTTTLQHMLRPPSMATDASRQQSTTKLNTSSCN